MEFSKKLSRQLKKVLSFSNFAEQHQGLAEWLKGAESSVPEEVKGNLDKMIEKLPKFLETVDQSYEQAEERVVRAERSLEISSRELFESNRQLNDLNLSMNALLDNLEEGYIVFSKDGVCETVYSKGAVNILGESPLKKTLWEIFNIEPDRVESFKDWYKFLQDRNLSFDDLAALGPQTYEGNADRSVTVSYRAMMDEENSQIMAVIVILRDITKEVASTEKAKVLENYSRMVVKFINDKNMFIQTIAQVKQTVQYLITWEKSNGEHDDVFSILRKLHTLKGACANMSMSTLADAFMKVENELSKSITHAFDDQLIRGTINGVGHKMESTLKTFLEQEVDFLSMGDLDRGKTKEVPIATLFKVGETLVTNQVAPEVLEEYINELISVPFHALFAVVESTAYSRAMLNDKEVVVSLDGPRDFYVIGEFYSDFFEELNNLINNCLDHGIELPKERRDLGKPSVGNLKIEFSQQDGKIHILIADDGKGIDTERLRNRIENSEKMTEQEVMNMIFEQGVTEKEEADQMAGRGVGMSAVKFAIETIGGSITVSSEPYQGTRFHITIPVLGMEHLMQSKFENGLSA